jgi:hypothetical protein
MPAAWGCTTSKLRSSLCILRIISRRCLRFISFHLPGVGGVGLLLVFLWVLLPVWDFSDALLFMLTLSSLNSTLARPGRRNSHNLSSGVGPLSLFRTIPPPSLQSPRTGAMLTCGQKCAKDKAALAVEPGCDLGF